MLKFILFDLDGTLLPMNQDEFVNHYFKLLCNTLKDCYPDSKKLIESVCAGTEMMINNDGSKINQDRFWDKIKEIYGKDVLNNKHLFDSFYKNEFNLAKSATQPNKIIEEIIDLLINKGYIIVLATNPLFPLIAVENRLKWAGLNKNVFTYITSYENSSYSKANINYYKDILNEINAKPEECLMVGNDVIEDLIASEIGIDTYLITDCIINKKNKDISNYKKGNIEEFKTFILDLPTVK